MSRPSRKPLDKDLYADVVAEAKARTRLLPARDYYNEPDVRALQHALKEGSDEAAHLMALDMAPHVPDDAVLVPMPSRKGYGGAGLMLAEHLSEITGRPVADVLRGGSRPSLYDLKKKGIDPQSVDLGFHLIDDLPEGTPVIVDNVVGTGHTARSALRAIPGALVLVHAVDRGIDARVNPSRRKPLDKDLYADVVAEAKARFDVWPSAYASGWVVKTYKARGGRYGGESKGSRTGLTKWFGESWVDLSRPIREDGEVVGYEPCGRKKSGDPADYPKCRPAKEAMRMTSDQVADAIKRKRAAEAKAGGRGGRGARAPVRVATYRANPVSAIQETTSPLRYHHDAPVYRLQVVDESAPPPDPRATYFAETTRTVRKGKNGQPLKTPRVEVTPGADEGVVAFLDFHRVPSQTDAIYIDYMATRNDQQGKGHATALVDKLYGMFPDAAWIDWGDIMSDAAWRIFKTYRDASGVQSYARGQSTMKNPSDDVFYHTTSFASVDSIAANGLRPRRGAGVYSHGGYGEHSQGKVFLAGDKDAALAWYGKIQNMLWHEHSDDEEPDELVPVMLRIDLSSTTLQEEVDPLGDRDVPGSYFVADVIPPDAIEFFDPSTKEWTPIEDWSADAYDGVESIEYFNDQGDVVDEDDTDEYGEQAWTARGFTVYGPYDDGGFKPSMYADGAWYP